MNGGVDRNLEFDFHVCQTDERGICKGVLFPEKKKKNRERMNTRVKETEGEGGRKRGTSDSSRPRVRSKMWM